MKRLVLIAVACALVTGACSIGRESDAKVHVADPGECTPVDVAAAPEIAPLLDDLADEFNDAPAAQLGPDECAFVRVQQIESAEAARQLTNGWPEPEDVGPAPALWAPASSAWAETANARAAETGAAPVAGDGPSFARSPLVVAMPRPMARALGWPDKKIGWEDLAELAADSRGWGAHGHPEWGAFKLGKASPRLSTAGLLATIAVDRLDDARATQALESAVIHYSDAAWSYLDTWWRLDRARTGKNYTYVSAVITDERSVTAYNLGSPNGIVPEDKTRKGPRVPLAAVMPAGGSLDADHPLLPVGAAWVTADAAAGARAFVDFATGPDAAAVVAEAGLRPGSKDSDASLASTRTAPSALASWETIRKRSRVMLLFDVSESMRDLSDHRDVNSPSKMELAKASLLDALSQFRDDDEVGLRIFTTDMTGGSSPYWSEVIPIGRFDTRRDDLVRAIEALEPRKGSPLYAATRDAYDAMAFGFDEKRINGVVLLTDGHNEVDEDDNRRALLAHLHEPVRVFPISYSREADFATLQRIAHATNARLYDAGDPEDIKRMFPAALANF